MKNGIWVGIIVLIAFALYIPYAIYKKEGRQAIIGTIFCVGGVLVALALYQLPIPDVYPRSDALTAKDQRVRVDHIFGAQTYYNYDGNEDPFKAGFLYTGPFIPEQSGKIYFRTKVLLWETKEYNSEFVTYEDVVERMEQMTDDTVSDTPSHIEDIETRSVSQKYTASYDALPENIEAGWGDNGGGRESVTIDDINNGLLGNTVVFNSITDGTIGNEKNFVSARLYNGSRGKDNIWNGNLLEVTPGSTYIVRLYGHNNNPYGEYGVARNVQAMIMLPEESGRTLVINGLIDTDNASPSRYWDSVILTSQDVFHLEYVEGSAVLKNTSIGSGDGYPLKDIINNWQMLGYDKLDGNIPGCFRYSFYISFKVIVVAD